MHHEKIDLRVFVENIMYDIWRVKFWKVGVIPKKGWAWPCASGLVHSYGYLPDKSYLLKVWHIIQICISVWNRNFPLYLKWHWYPGKMTSIRQINQYFWEWTSPVRTHPSFGMKMTKTLRSIFSVCVSYIFASDIHIRHAQEWSD